MSPTLLGQVFGLLASAWEEEVLEQEVADAERWLSDPAARTYFWNVLREGLSLGGVRPERLLLERLSQLKMVVLGARGKNDQVLYFNNVKKIRARLPDARYVICADSGHMLPYEVAGPFSRNLIECLK